MVQGGKYWKRRKGDDRWLQVLVALLLVLELGHTLACMGTVYYYTVTLFDSAVKPGSCYSFSVAVLLSASIISLVQIFYVYRCYRFSNNLLLSLIGYVVVLAHFAGSIWLSYQSWLASTDSNPFVVQMDFGWLLTTALGLKALVDVYAAGSLCWYLKKTLEGQPFDNTAKLLKRILVWTIETGLITSVASIVVLVCFQSMKYNYVWVAIFLSLTKLYSISLIASLNQRKVYRTEYPIVTPQTTIPRSPMRFRSEGTSDTYIPISSRPPSRDGASFPSQRRWTDAARVIPLTESVIRRSTISL
jgi:hypothetical protein